MHCRQKVDFLTVTLSERTVPLLPLDDLSQSYPCGQERLFTACDFLSYESVTIWAFPLSADQQVMYDLTQTVNLSPNNSPPQ